MTAAVPLLVTGQLTELDRHLGGPAVMRSFLSAFVQLLPSRLERIRAAFVARNSESGMDAVLSLETSAAQARAVALAEAAARLRRRVQDCRGPDAMWPEAEELAEAMSHLSNLAERTAQCVRNYLGGNGDRERREA